MVRTASQRYEMPDDEYELRTTGILPPRSDGMKCATCGLPVALVYNHEPGIRPGKGQPGLIWGKDVSVICMCCSYAHCTHKKEAKVE